VRFGAPIYVRHEIVHNTFVVNDLKAKGAIFIEDLADVPPGATLVFSAHGVSKAVRSEAARRGFQVFDATCPLVTKVHVEVAKLAREGYEFVMIGHAGHPEVEGTMGQLSDGIYLVEDTADVERVQPRGDKLAVVTQTTLSVDDAAEILAAEGVEGLEFTVLCIQGYADGEKTSTIWQAGLAEAGITMNIEVQELSVWLDNYINHTYDIIWNVFPGFADPNYFVGFGLQPHLADGWTNADAKAAADGAVQTIDQAERTELYGQLQEMFVADLPCLIVQEAPAASVVAKNVAGWDINPLGFIHLDGVTLS